MKIRPLTLDMIAYLLVPRRDDDISLSVTYNAKKNDLTI